MSDYISNLKAPDLRKYFKHTTSRVMGHSLGHEVLSDWSEKSDDDPVFGIYRQCGMWTRDEAAILYTCALRSPGWWLDIGAHTGWTTAHIIAAGRVVAAVDYMFSDQEFAGRFKENLANLDGANTETHYRAVKSDEFFPTIGTSPFFAGCVIDGDHNPPQPLRDAQNCAEHLRETGVILLHDFTGEPVQEATEWLMDHGFRCRLYWTPHMIACCYRGEFVPPLHDPDPAVEAMLKDGRIKFAFGRCT